MKLAVAIAAVFAAIRIWMGLRVPPESVSLVGTYKALAHLFVGGLAVAWWAALRASWDLPNRHPFKTVHREKRIYGSLFWGLCGVEIAVAVLSRVK